MEEQEIKQPDKRSKYSWISKIAIFAVVLVISGAILTQTHFLEGLLKFLGVGASTTEYQEEQTPEEVLPVQLAKIEFNYYYITAPKSGSVRINVAKDGKLIIEKSGLDLEAAQKITLSDVGLAQGEQYVAVLEGEGVDPKILYFVATEKDTDNYSFTFGEFLPSYEQSFAGDFNGDGAVDSSDYAIFLQKMKDDFERRGEQ